SGWSLLGFFLAVLPQWLVLHRYSRFAGLTWWRWMLAFVYGAFLLVVPAICELRIAGLIGGSTAQADFLTAIRNQPPDQTNFLLDLVLQIVTSAIASLVFAYFQWRILRNYVQEAIWWIPANVLAGMVTAITSALILSVIWGLGADISKGTSA